MIRPSGDVAVYLCVVPVDMRKQAASLALLIEQSLGLDVFSAAVFCFANAKRDLILSAHLVSHIHLLYSTQIGRPQ